MSKLLTNALEDVVHERVQDQHRLVRDTGTVEDARQLVQDDKQTESDSLRVHLLQDLVNVGRVSFLSRLGALLLLLAVGCAQQKSEHTIKSMHE